MKYFYLWANSKMLPSATFHWHLLAPTMKSEVCRLNNWLFGALFRPVKSWILASSIWNSLQSMTNTLQYSLGFHHSSHFCSTWRSVMENKPLLKAARAGTAYHTHLNPLSYLLCISDTICHYVTCSQCSLFVKNPSLHLAFAPKTWGNLEPRSSSAGCLII